MIMEKNRILSIVFLLAIGVSALVGLQYCLASQGGGDKPASVLMQEALYAEEIQGDLNGAIKIYEQIIKSSTAQRSNIAEAMYREGMCYMKLQNEKQAQEIFRTLVANYSDQTNIISKVKPLLEDLGNADPAALMPPDTLWYAELGSPGRQVETILKMLEGTPLENPLAAIGGNNTGSSWSSNQMGPAQMIAALLNPNMMAEFKKIRGMGVGIMGIPQNDAPPAIVVLFPGKSDALKGLLTMVLTMAGKPMESIEGMQTVNIQDGGVAVYDENVVIFASPKAYAAGQLVWSVKQYKGLTNEPTLASSNKSFAKVSKKAREENVLTIWMDADRIFTGLKQIFPEGQMPIQLRMAEGSIDMQNIDDITAFLSLKVNEIAVEATIAFKEGYNSLGYAMLRTPSLSKAGFQAVPSGAVGLISLALGEAESAQAQALSQRIQNMTGLEIGKEIFANIEQVTLFVLPAGNSVAQTDMKVPPIITSIGLAITSRDPEQTRQILTKLLSAAKLAAAEATTEVSVATAGKYQIDLVEGQKLYGYMDQDNKTNVLSLSPVVVEASESAIKNQQSVLTAGPLQGPLNNISPSTSKLILVNVGGALQIAQTNMGSMAGEGNIKDIFTQLAASCNKTYIKFRTEEKENNFDIRAELSGIPPINNIFGPIMQLAQIIEQQQQSREQEKLQTAQIKKTSQAPVIDGQAEDVWSQAKKYQLTNSIYSPASSAQDLSAYYKAMWDQENLYLLVDVTDDVLKNDSEEFYYDDTVEIFIDADNSRDSQYGEHDYTYDFCWDRTNPRMEERGQLYQKDDIKYALVTTDNGYRLEIKFPWQALGAKPFPGAKIGLDVHVNDDDDGGERDTKLTWSDQQDNAWQNPKVFGIAELTGLVGWWKLDESQGDHAADSSGNNNTGTLVGGPKWLPSGGKIGGALELDGVNDFVNTDNTTDFSNWTIAVWVKSPAAPSNEVPSGPISREKNYQINWNHIVDEFRGAAGICINGNWYSASFGALQPNTWYRLVATYDGENLKAYKDGVLITDNADPSGKADHETETLKFGRHARDENFFAGTIDDIRIYNYALPQEEIKALGN
jgi:tetratricopeptide (TPR) repeat protein